MIDGPLLKKIGKLAFPVMLANLLQTLVGVADTLMIGRLGPLAIAAVGMSNTIRFLVFIMVVAVSGGAISLMAQAKGSRDPQRMSDVAKQSILTGLMISAVIMVVGILLAKPLLHFMNSGAEVEAEMLGFNYLIVLFLGSPFLVLNLIMNRMMQGAGDSITPLWLTGGIVVLNLIFNYILIFGWWIFPAMGIMGAALGTVIARGIGVLIAFYIFKSGRNVVRILPAGGWRLRIQMVKDLLSIGVPSGVQGVFRHGGKLLLTALLTATELGTMGAAVLAIGFQIEQLAIQPTVGLNVACTSLVGQQVGKWQISEAFKRGSIVIGTGVLFMGLVAIPMVIYVQEILLLFDPSANEVLLNGGVSFFNINMPFLPIAAVSVVAVGALRGAGDTQPAMYSAILNRTALTVGMAWLLAFPLGLGSAGIWWGIVIGRVADTIFLGVVWMRKNWKYIALRKTDVYRTHLHLLPEPVLQQYLRDVRGVQMRESGMMEVVSENNVIYKNENGGVKVVFNGQAYTILNK